VQHPINLKLKDVLHTMHLPPGLTLSIGDVNSLASVYYEFDKAARFGYD